MFRDSFSVFSERPERDGLVDKEPQLELPLEVDHSLQRTDLASVQVDCLDHQKLPPNFGRFGMLKLFLITFCRQSTDKKINQVLTS